MARIIIRLLIALVLLVNLVMLIISYISGVNVYKKYGALILKIAGIFVLVAMAFYVALGLTGIH